MKKNITHAEKNERNRQAAIHTIQVVLLDLGSRFGWRFVEVPLTPSGSKHLDFLPRPIDLPPSDSDATFFHRLYTYNTEALIANNADMMKTALYTGLPDLAFDFENGYLEITNNKPEFQTYMDYLRAELKAAGFPLATDTPALSSSVSINNTGSGNMTVSFRDVIGGDKIVNGNEYNAQGNINNTEIRASDDTNEPLISE